MNNESLPNAIRLFNLYEETNEDNKWKCAKFIMTEHNVTDYYLYCKCMNFTRKEQRLDFNERDIDSEDILYEGDISRLKFSFLWSIKDSYYRNSILKTHWILHHFSADNDPSRWIINGMRLETVKVTGLDNDWVKNNNLLASIFIIEDMFEQLWSIQNGKTLKKVSEPCTVRCCFWMKKFLKNISCQTGCNLYTNR